MKRLLAAALLAAAVTPFATASALPPPHNSTVACTMRYVVDETDVRDYLWCLSLRES